MKSAEETVAWVFPARSSACGRILRQKVRGAGPRRLWKLKGCDEGRKREDGDVRVSGQ